MVPAQLPPRHLLPAAGETALLVIDAQERLAAAMPPGLLPGVVRNIRILIETASLFGLPVLVSEQYPAGLGPTMPEIRAALPIAVIPAEKLAFSCCRAPTLSPALNALEQPGLILCGMEAHVCVLQTAIDLLEAGKRVYIAADAVCSRTERNLQIGLDLLRQAGAVIGSTELFAFALAGGAGNETFKQVSRLVK